MYFPPQRALAFDLGPIVGHTTDSASSVWVHGWKGDQIYADFIRDEWLSRHDPLSRLGGRNCVYEVRQVRDELHPRIGDFALAIRWDAGSRG